MPSPYYDKIVLLLKNIVDDEKIEIPEIFAVIKKGENNAGITKAWIYSLYNEIPKDPGIKRMDALYRVLRKLKQKINRKK